jgi:hypothetical protein
MVRRVVSAQGYITSPETLNPKQVFETGVSVIRNQHSWPPVNIYVRCLQHLGWKVCPEESKPGRQVARFWRIRVKAVWVDIGVSRAETLVTLSGSWLLTRQTMNHMWMTSFPQQGGVTPRRSPPVFLPGICLSHFALPYQNRFYQPQKSTLFQLALRWKGFPSSASRIVRALQARCGSTVGPTMGRSCGVLFVCCLLAVAGLTSAFPWCKAMADKRRALQDVEPRTGDDAGSILSDGNWTIVFQRVRTLLSSITNID